MKKYFCDWNFCIFIYNLFIFFQLKVDIESPEPVHHVDVDHDTATFGMGCFWGADALYGATPGVLRTKVGYAGGAKVNPTYKDL